jgi:hypothetical protein
MSQSSTELTDQNRYILRSTETALRTGREVWAWWHESEKTGSVKRSVLLSPTRTFESFAIYDTLTLGGKETTVMGCLQKASFQKNTAAGAGPRGNFEEFFREKLPFAFHYTHPDGQAGGFLYQPLLAKLKGVEEYQSGAELAPAGSLSLSKIGTLFEWVAYRIDLLDFGRSVPALSSTPRLASRLLKEALYAVVHEDFVFKATNPPPGAIAQMGFGYSVLPCVVIPNIFGYGPGRFGAAVQDFRFTLMENGDLEINMDFISSPRSEKVLNIGGFDPVYSLVHVLDAITFSHGKLSTAVHNSLDAVMLKQHVRVHENVILGTRQIWDTQDWAAAMQRAR